MGTVQWQTRVEPTAKVLFRVLLDPHFYNEKICFQAKNTGLMAQDMAAGSRLVVLRPVPDPHFRSTRECLSQFLCLVSIPIPAAHYNLADAFTRTRMAKA
jgi:hypothetical protein